MNNTIPLSIALVAVSAFAATTSIAPDPDASSVRTVRTVRINAGTEWQFIPGEIFTVDKVVDITMLRTRPGEGRIWIQNVNHTVAGKSYSYLDVGDSDSLSPEFTFRIVRRGYQRRDALDPVRLQFDKETRLTLMPN